MKSRRRPVSTDRRYTQSHIEDIPDSFFVSDCGPSERWQHSGRLLEYTDRAGVLASRAMEECVLDTLLLQGHLNARMLTAALRLRRDFIRADLSARLVGSYNPARVATSYYEGCDDRSPIEEEAYARWRAAVIAIGEMFNDIVVTVACHDIAPVEAQLLPLQMGLTRLAGFYKIPKSGENVDEAATRKIRVHRGGIGNGGRGNRSWFH